MARALDHEKPDMELELEEKDALKNSSDVTLDPALPYRAVTMPDIDELRAAAELVQEREELGLSVGRPPPPSACAVASRQGSLTTCSHRYQHSPKAVDPAASSVACTGGERVGNNSHYAVAESRPCRLGDAGCPAVSTGAASIAAPGAQRQPLASTAGQCGPTSNFPPGGEGQSVAAVSPSGHRGHLSLEKEEKEQAEQPAEYKDEDPIPWLRVNVARYASYFMLHFLYFCFLNLFGAVMIYQFEHGRIRFVDTLFVAASASSMTGLSTVQFVALSLGSQLTLMSLIILGSQVLMSAVPVLLRRHFYQKRAQRAIETLHRYNTCPEPADEASGTSMSSLSTGKANEHVARPGQSLSRSASQGSTDPPHGPRAAPEVLPGAVSFLRGRWPRKVSATASTDIAVPIVDQAAKAFLPYPYAFVSVDELLCNEVAEYQALNLLLKCIVLYFFFVQLFPLLIWGFYLSSARPVNVNGSFEVVQNPWYFAAFHVVSSFNNCGFTLLEGNLVSLVEDRCVLLLMSLLVLLGNTFYPIAMRFIVWCVHCSNLAKEELEAADENDGDQCHRLHGAHGELPVFNGMQQQKEPRAKPVESQPWLQQVEGSHVGSLWGRGSECRKKVYCDTSRSETQLPDVNTHQEDCLFHGKRSKMFDTRSRRFSRSLLSPPNQSSAQGFSQTRSYWGFRFLKAMERRCKKFFRILFLCRHVCRGFLHRCFCCCQKDVVPVQTAKRGSTRRWSTCIFEAPRNLPEHGRNGRISAFPASTVTHFLLDDPRRCFTHMFRGSQTWWLLVVACTILLVEIVTYMALDFRKPHLRQFSTGTKFLIAWFQSVSIRTAGFNVIDIAQSSRAVQLLWVCFMYIASYPFIIAVRSTSTHVASPKTAAAASTSGPVPVESEDAPDDLEPGKNEKETLSSSLFCEIQEKNREQSTVSGQGAGFDAEVSAAQLSTTPEESERILDSRSPACFEGHDQFAHQASFSVRRSKPFCRRRFDLPSVKECQSVEGGMAEELERTYETQVNKNPEKGPHVASMAKGADVLKETQTTLATTLPYTAFSEKDSRDSDTVGNNVKSIILQNPQEASDMFPSKATQLGLRTLPVEESFNTAPPTGEGPAPEPPASRTDDTQPDSQNDAILAHADPSDGAPNPWTAALNSAWLQSHREAVIRQTQALLLKDVFWLFLVVFFICIFEDAQMSRGETRLHIFSIVFETVSAYGTVGLSMGAPDEDFSLSGVLGTGSKILLILLMLLGRHRGLPLAIDRSVNLPDLLNARSAVDRRNSQEAGAGIPSHSLLTSQVRRCASQPCQVAPDTILSTDNPWNNQLNLAMHYYRHPISREQLQAHRAWLSGKLLRVRSGTPQSTITVEDVAPPASFLCSGPALFREMPSQKHQLQRGLESRGEAHSTSSGGGRQTSETYAANSGVPVSSVPGTYSVDPRENEDQKGIGRGSALPSRFYSHVTLPTAPSVPLLPYTVFWAPTVPTATTTGSAGHRRFDPVCNLGVDEGRPLTGSHFPPASWNPGMRAPWSRPSGYPG